MVRAATVDVPLREDHQRPDRRETLRILNVPLLIGTVVGTVVICLAAYFWHSHQLGRIATALLDRAASLEAEENWEAAAGYFHRYLQLDPGYADAQVRRAQAYDKHAKGSRKSQAVDYYYQALGVAPVEQRPALRRRLTELLLELGRFASAEAESKKLLDGNNEDPPGKRLLALSLHRRFRSGAMPSEYASGASVSEMFEEALLLNPGDIQLSVELAQIYREEEKLLNDQKQALSDTERAQLADEIMDRLVRNSPKDAEAFLARCRYRLRHNLPDAKADLETALKLGPDHVDVRLLAAAHAQRNAMYARHKGASDDEIREYHDLACKHYRHVIEHVDPTNVLAHLGLGEVYRITGQLDRAIETWKAGRKDGEHVQNVPLNLKLANALVARGRLTEAKAILGELDAGAERLGLAYPREDRATLGCSISLIRAKWMLAHGDLGEAIPVLHRVTRSTTKADQAFTSWLLLGRVHAALRHWDESAVAYERAARLKPDSSRARLGAATAWESADRPEAAIHYYKQALEINQTPEAWLSMARAQLQYQAKLPSKERNWDAFDKALAEAKAPEGRPPLQNAWRLNLTEAYALAMRSDERGELEAGIQSALKMLRETETATQPSTEFLKRLALAYVYLGAGTDAIRAAEKYEKLDGKSVPTYLLRSRLLVQQKQYDQARQVLRDGIAAVSKESKTRLAYALAQINVEQGRLSEALQDLSKLFDVDPTNARLARELADLAFETGNFKAARRWETKLEELEGPDGCSWRYYRARRLVRSVTGPQDPRLAKIDELRLQIESRRPAWSATHLLHGMILEQRAQPEKAIDAYQIAINSGEQRLAVYERLILLLYQMKRYGEADRYLSQLEDRLPASSNLTTLGISVAAKQGEMARAEEVARQGVRSRPNDPMARVWLGHMLLANENTEEAERAFLQAVELAPADARVYQGQFTFYLRTKQPDRARETLLKLAENAKLTDVQRAFVLAQGYEMLEDPAQAEVHYGKAAELAPDDQGVQMHLASFQLRARRYTEAEPTLRHVLELAPESREARRKLAACLAVRGGKKEWIEAQELMDQADSDEDTPGLDQRLQAVLLAGRGGKENYTKARQLLEKLVADPAKAVDGDRLLLVRLYEAEGKIQAARQQFMALVGRADPNPAHLASFIDMLLRLGSYEDALAWLNRFDEIALESPTAVGLRARWLHAMGRADEIEPLVEPVADKLLKQIAGNPEQEKQLATNIGQLYLSAQRFQAAERWFRRLVQLAPEQYGPLAMALSQQGRTREAVRVCLAAAESDGSPRPAVTLATALMAAQPTLEESQLAEPLFEKTLRNHKDDIELLFYVASLRVVQQRSDDAARLYRQVLRLNPKHLLAMNNLATLLAEQPDQRAEALAQIDRAIEIVGPQATLLDTKGMIYVHQQQSEKAVECLETAARGPGFDPRYLFHLAVAYQQVGELDKAREVLKKAHDGYLTQKILTRTDQEMLVELERKLRN